MFHSQFGFFDDNETVVEMQHQDVSENQTRTVFGFSSRNVSPSVIRFSASVCG